MFPHRLTDSRAFDIARALIEGFDPKRAVGGQLCHELIARLARADEQLGQAGRRDDDLALGVLFQQPVQPCAAIALDAWIEQINQHVRIEGHQHQSALSSRQAVWASSSSFQPLPSTPWSA